MATPFGDADGAGSMKHQKIESDRTVSLVYFSQKDRIVESKLESSCLLFQIRFFSKQRSVLFISFDALHPPFSDFEVFRGKAEDDPDYAEHMHLEARCGTHGESEKKGGSSHGSGHWGGAAES